MKAYVSSSLHICIDVLKRAPKHRRNHGIVHMMKAQVERPGLAFAVPGEPNSLGSVYRFGDVGYILMLLPNAFPSANMWVQVGEDESGWFLTLAVRSFIHSGLNDWRSSPTLSTVVNEVRVCCIGYVLNDDVANTGS